MEISDIWLVRVLDYLKQQPYEEVAQLIAQAAQMETEAHKKIEQRDKDRKTIKDKPINTNPVPDYLN